MCLQICFFDSTFSKEEFVSEKKVIVEELKMGEDQPDDYLFDLFYESQIGDNSLGRPIAGNARGIQRTTRDELYEYYRSHYGPEGTVLSLAGRALLQPCRKTRAHDRNFPAF
jgi:predicted Zn-dependent peptidase